MSTPTPLEILSENALRSLRPPAFLKALYAEKNRRDRPSQAWLGALIRCSCFEENRCKAPPFPRHWLVTDDEGWLSLTPPHHLDPQKQRDFQDWMKNACAHPEMNLKSSSFSPFSMFALQWFLTEVTGSKNSFMRRMEHCVPSMERFSSDEKQAAKYLKKSLNQNAVAAGEVKMFKNQIGRLLNKLTALRDLVSGWRRPGWRVSFSGHPMGYFSAIQSSPSTLLFSSDDHDLGICDVGIFVKERNGRVMHLVPQLEIRAERLPNPFLKASKGALEDPAWNETRFRLAFTPDLPPGVSLHLSTDRSAIWQMSQAAFTQCNKPRVLRKHTTIKLDKVNIAEIAERALRGFFDAASVAERAKQPLIGVF